MLNLVAWLGLLTAIVALGVAWKLNSELAVASRRLDRYNKALFDANDEMRKLREQLELETAQLRLAIRQSGGAAVFVPDMTVREVLLAHPQAEQVLAGFHLGGCSHCAVEPDDTLAGACREHGVDLPILISNLNMLAHGQTANGAPQLVKLPNVALEFE